MRGVDSYPPLAVARGLITEAQRDAFLADMATAERVYPQHSAMWPLLIGAVKRR